MDVQLKTKILAEICGVATISNILHKVAEFERQKYRLQLDELDRDLSVYEKKFQISTESAKTNYEKGKLGDNEDIMEWMALYDDKLLLSGYLEKLYSIR